MNIADESFPEVSLASTSSSEDEDLRKLLPEDKLTSLKSRRSYNSAIDVRKSDSTRDALRNRSKSHNELNNIDSLAGMPRRRSSQAYKHVPSRVRQYISSLPQPSGTGKRLIKQQTMPEMSQVLADADRADLQELTVKYEIVNQKLQEEINNNSQLRRKIEQMRWELENARKSEVHPPATLEPSETLHLQEPETGVRKRFVEAEEKFPVSSVVSSGKRRRGKRHKLRKILTKLVCCSGSDSLTIHDGYMELPKAS